MKLFRTPDERFQDLPQWPWTPRYFDDLPGFKGIRIHRVDEPGRPGAPTALLLHGNPAWSYLYRTMIPVFLEAGLRVVAPDLIGFGRSDKPADAAFHRFATHRHFLMSLIERLDLSNVLLVVQDWGGILLVLNASLNSNTHRPNRACIYDHTKSLLKGTVTTHF